LIDKEKLKKLFPNLADEMEQDVSRVHIDQYRRQVQNEDQLPTRRWASYSPDVVDFLRRCENEEQAEEVINFLEGRGEITVERAEELRVQIRKGGLRSLGGKRKPDYYHRRAEDSGKMV
jgi:hypothetical protein